MALPAIGVILLGVIIAAAFRILVALGIGFVAFTVALPSFYNFISSYFQELPPDILQMVGMLRVDQAITLILSAGAAKLAYKISAAPPLFPWELIYGNCSLYRCAWCWQNPSLYP